MAVAVLLALPVFVVVPLVNMLAAIGEELGWRGYLWARLAPLGPRRAALLIGVIWGVWHAPLIAMGYNYPDAPVLGPLLMTGFALAYGVPLAWLRIRSGSVWPAALAHGAVNADAGVMVVFLTPASRLVGTPIGWVALIPAALFAVALLRFGRWDPKELSAQSGGPRGSASS
jgi:membrane protease YdiL (CAAX protease family)